MVRSKVCVILPSSDHQNIHLRFGSVLICMIYFLNGSSGYTVHLEWLKICQIPGRTPESTLTPLHRGGTCLSSSFHPSPPEESRGPGLVSPFGRDSGGWSNQVFKPWSYDDFESFNMVERRQRVQVW